ncbi:MAG: efflux transporter periplasmic adaptor subunit [Planctomycetes bacterium]|nr:efflux transporter periplasmic adaptor subunit [Planctomycetota bacterium]
MKHNLSSNVAQPSLTAKARRRQLTSRRGKAQWIALAVIIGLGGTAVAYRSMFGSSQTISVTEMITDTVRRGPFDHIVLEDGEIESSENQEVICQVKSRAGSGTPILWVIDEGTYVKKGDKLVELDESALQTEVKSQRIVVSTAEATVIGSEAQLKQDEIARQEYLEGTYLTERKTILSEIALAEQELRKSELQLGSAERLAAKGTLKPLQIEAENFAVQNARNKLDSARARLKVLDELTKAKMLVQFDSNIEKAKAKLDSDRNTLEEEKAKLIELEQQIQFCTIISPAEGQVVHANKFSQRGNSEFVVEAGALARERQTLVVLPDPTKMQVKAKINESRITLVNEGMPCKIRVNAVEGDLLGQVTKVNKYAEPGSWFSSSVKEYATYIQIINPPSVIRTGMTAEVRIFVEQLKDALQIPVHAIYEHKGHLFTLVKAGNNFETREVKIGASNEKMVTINEGLKEGETVVLNPRSHMDKMQLPKIEETTDRGALEDIAKNAPAKPEGAPPGQKPGGGGGPGGGEFSAASMADRALESADKNKDGELSLDEVEGMDERMRESAKAADTNADGKITKAELISAMAKVVARIKAMQAAGGGPGGGPGGPGGGGPGGGGGQRSN